MDFCRLYGVSATQAVLQGLRQSQLRKLVGLMNSPVDIYNVKCFQNELRILKDFLSRCVTTRNIDNFAINKGFSSGRQLSAYLRACNQYYAGAPVNKEIKHSKEWVEEVQKEIDLLPSEVLPAVKLLNGEVVNLSDEEFTVIKYFYENKHVIESYEQAIEISAFTEIKVFGTELYRLKSADEGKVTGRVINHYLKGLDSITDKTSRIMFLRRCLEDCNFILANTVESDDGSEYIQIGRTKTIKEKADKLFKEMINHPNTKARLNPEHKQLFNLIVQRDITSLFSPLDCKFVVSFVYDAQYSVEAYNSIFGLNITSEDEFNKIFDSLCDKGLIGLNFEVFSFFDDFLKTVSLKAYSNNTISKDSPLVNVARLLLRDIESELALLGGV